MPDRSNPNGHSARRPVGGHSPRRQRLVTAVIALGWTILLTCPGCVHPLVMTQRDYDFYNSMSISYGEPNYDEIVETVGAFPPRTVVDPTEKEKWELSLTDAKRIALNNNKQVLVFANQPGQVGSLVDIQLAQFDAIWGMGGGWSRADVPLTTTVANAGTGQGSLRIDSFGTSSRGGGQFLGVGGANFGINATPGGPTIDALQSTPGQNFFELVKRNATGGTTKLAYDIGYTFQNQVGIFTSVNPAWTNEVSARVTQPFLQGAGVEFNRAATLVARANFEQSVRVFEQAVQTILRDTENAYWGLGYAYYDLYSREVGLEQALATWQKLLAEYQFGRSSRADLAQAREQLEFFRAQRIEALGRLLTSERTLRLAMGIPPEDNRQIVPADEPTTAEYTPDWETAVLEAVSLRPEIVGQTYTVRAAELELFRQQNGLQADLTGFAEWSVIGLDNALDQAFDRMTDFDNEGWTLGLRYAKQIGERAAHAQVRAQQQTLDRERRELENSRHVALHELTDVYRNLLTNNQLIRVQGDRRRAAATQVKAANEQYQLGRVTLDQFLDAQTALADAIRDEGLAVAQYNQSLIQWEFAKGTILTHDNVLVADGAQSPANRKLLDDRRKQWENSLPLPIWPGSKVTMDHVPCPDKSGPMYPDFTGSVGEVLKDVDGAPELTPPAEEVPLSPPPAEETK